MLIGITGMARSGKDTVGNYLVQNGFHLYKMAYPLKKCIAQRFGLTFDEVDSGDWRDQPSDMFGYNHLQSFTNEIKFFSLRSWMQWLGTEVGRDIFGKDAWIIPMIAEWENIKNQNLPGMVITDIRFDNEAKAVIDLGGTIVRVIRPNIIGVEDHASEAGIDDKYITDNIMNDSDIPTLLSNAKKIFNINI